ncbi:WD40 repeat-like protein [Aulographum hederae CBS 113979]|uniref:WD40 repeat-like protein n=1 Tax=Aulographum hederae CBS 113979 TaxID=1176131 RepID=A0A6G1HGB2_9PEZI|nr:WD40 repeat-like protein [Aulographum hederae CBS 113979]
MSMITATTWVPRGFAAPFPTKYAFDEEEYSRIAKLAKLQLEDAEEDLEEAQEEEKKITESSSSKVEVNGSGKSKQQDDEEIDDDLKEYDLEHYDDDLEDTNGDPVAMFTNTKSMMYYQNDEEDPYITLKDDESEDEDRENLQILATDNLLLAARIEDEVAHLECYVYEDEADNLYVHHDIMLPAIPLAVEWLDFAVGKAAGDSKGNFVAVGTMDPDIELWDLDTVDMMYPSAILGQGAEDLQEDKGASKPKKKKKRSKGPNDAYHTDAVLSLAANRHHRSLLASSSADKTIKLWDLNTTKAAQSYSHHTDKVCALAWHPTESTVLLSGSYDRTVVAKDMRAPASAPPRWGVESDVETVKWDPLDPNYFYISTESGTLHFHDARNAPSKPEQSKPVWTLAAHSEALSAFDVNPFIPGYLATGSVDKTVKLWDITPTGPTQVVSRDLGVGRVFSTVFAPDREVGFRLAVAGSKGAVRVWDTSTNRAIRTAFAAKTADGPLKLDASKEVEERMVALDEDSESDSEEGEDEAEGGADGWESMEE